MHLPFKPTLLALSNVNFGMQQITKIEEQIIIMSMHSVAKGVPEAH